MDSDELSGSSSRSVSPPSIRPRDHLQRTAGITTHEYLDDEYEDVSFDAVYNQPLTRTKEDDINLQYAAATARLPFDMMIDVEMEMFSDYVSDQVHVNTYLYIRNMILNLWNTNPSMELALENVFEEMPSAYRSLNYLIVKTFAFLERYGYINFGHFTTVEEMLKKNFSEKTNNSTARSAASLLSTRTKNNGYKIIVIGAGIAGLVAASQLKFLGFEVMVIEARNRIGGRIFTSETVNKLATDMGPSLVEGTNGNPLITLLKQTSAVHRRIDFDCSLYDDDGQLPFEYCELMAETFRRLSEAVILLSKENKVHEINGRPLSIQDTYDHFILLQEANVALQRREYYATIDELSDTLEKQSKALILTKDIMDTIATRLQEMYDSDPTPIREDFSLIETEAELQRVAAIKSLRYELSEACSIYDRLQVELTDIQHTMSTVRMKEPSEIYLTAMDRRMLDFYFANLELRLGTVLKNVSLSGFASIMTNHFGAKYYEGVEMEDKKFGDLETKTEFTEYAQKAGNAFTERSDAQFYSDFVYTLVDQIKIYDDKIYVLQTNNGWKSLAVRTLLVGDVIIKVDETIPTTVVQASELMLKGLTTKKYVHLIIERPETTTGIRRVRHALTTERQFEINPRLADDIVAGEATSTPIGTEVQAAATPMYSIYEIASDDITFGSPRQSWKQPRHFLDDPTVLAIGGLKGQADAAPALTFFNCRTREWSSTDLWNHIPISLSYFGLAHLPERRKLFVIGGDAMMETVDNTFNKASREVISIDTNNLRQKQCSSISKGLIGLTCCAASANQLLACGGFHYAPKFYRSTVTYTNKFLAFSYVYNVETGLWKEVKRMIDRRAYAAGANVNDRIYMTAGFEGACTLNEVEYYDFPSNRWISAPRLPSKRMQHGALSTHGVLFVCGGMDMNFYENTPIYTSSSVFLDPRERVDGGISTLLKPLTKQLNIQHNQIVTAIEYDEKQQQVFVKHVKNPRSKEAKEQTRTEEDDEPQPLERVYRAHAVVCAVPLGCLKKRNVEQLHVDSKGIHPPDLKFHPPLPDRKRQVIDGMAVGSANKIVIEFQKRFWDSDFFFGKINDKECARGEFFLYTSAPNSRILTVHMAGAAANLNDSFSMQDLSNKVMQILGRIFGQDCPARPVQLITTRWHEDELSHGCFPYIPVNRSDEDYDVMAEPVLPPAANNSTRPYLFFAGDHTSREFPGRVHGAFLSGIREAARIANHFLGPINSSENRERFERLGRMFVINTPQQLHQSDSDD
ncbi:SWIRM domain-containing protein [Aphelenchoides besseyi]|nr:SWIRM domain-containing protein [Aphelenchoides besseyi]